MSVKSQLSIGASEETDIGIVKRAGGRSAGTQCAGRAGLRFVTPKLTVFMFFSRHIWTYA
jgi:hypothetical protein